MPHEPAREQASLQSATVGPRVQRRQQQHALTFLALDVASLAFGALAPWLAAPRLAGGTTRDAATCIMRAKLDMHVSIAAASVRASSQGLRQLCPRTPGRPLTRGSGVGRSICGALCAGTPRLAVPSSASGTRHTVACSARAHMLAACELEN